MGNLAVASGAEWMDGLDWRPKDGRSGRWREERPRHSHSASVDIDETSWTARQQRWKRDAAVRAADVREAADGLLRRGFCRLDAVMPDAADAVMPAAVADGSGQAGCDERGNVNICAASAAMPDAAVGIAARLGMAVDGERGGLAVANGSGLVGCYKCGNSISAAADAAMSTPVARAQQGLRA